MWRHSDKTFLTHFLPGVLEDRVAFYLIIGHSNTPVARGWAREAEESCSQRKQVIDKKGNERDSQGRTVKKQYRTTSTGTTS